MARTLLAALLLATGLAGCGGGDEVEGPPPAAPARIVLRSPAFDPGGAMPARLSCDGAGDSPELRWSGVPREARSLALVVEDPDAPGGTFVHWTGWDISPTAARLAGAAPTEGENSSGGRGWTPPCPPSGTHRYRFLLYALRAPLALDAGAKPDDVRDRIAELAIARGELVGRYARQ